MDMLCYNKMSIKVRQNCFQNSPLSFNLTGINENTVHGKCNY